jgi:hypothetical protein
MLTLRHVPAKHQQLQETKKENINQSSVLLVAELQQMHRQ